MPSNLTANAVLDLQAPWDKCCCQLCVWLCAASVDTVLSRPAWPEKPFHSMNFIEIPAIIQSKSKKSSTWENSGTDQPVFQQLTGSIWLGLEASYLFASKEAYETKDSCFVIVIMLFVEPCYWHNNIPKYYTHTWIYIYLYINICIYTYTTTSCLNKFITTLCLRCKDP